MAKKTRYPQRLNWEDYLTFMSVDLLPWLLLQVGKPDYMASLVVGLSDKIDAYRDALNLYKAKNVLAPEQRKLLATKFTALREGLLRAKISLPVFFPDPAVLGEFGLAVNITNDEDDMFVVASNCLAHWDLVKLLPEYADLVPDFTALQTVFDDYNVTRALYTQTFQEAQIAQNDMITARDVCNEQERKLFDWYRSRHRDVEGEWWTGSPWGAVGGGDEEPGGPELPEIPAAPTGFAVELRMEPSPFMLISCDPYGEHSGFDIKRAETPAGVTEPPDMGDELFMQNTGLPLMDGEINPGMKYWYQIRARNGEEVGEWTEIVGVEYK